VCLSVQASKLYHMGFSEPVRRSTLADPAFRCARRMPTKREDANESRDWRIYADLAQRLIRQARKLYAKEDLGLDLTNTVYALDSTTIDLCLSVFPWAHFRSTKHAPAKAGGGSENAHAARSARQYSELYPRFGRQIGRCPRS
jgi:hypothetical protein